MIGKGVALLKGSIGKGTIGGDGALAATLRRPALLAANDRPLECLRHQVGEETLWHVWM